MGDPAGETLILTRDFAASPSRVWAAWTDPRRMLLWLGPVDWPATEVLNDLRCGGSWRACLTSATGERLWQSGRYLTIDPPSSLTFTFRWEGDNHEDGPSTETIVTVLLEGREGGGTRMVFTQERFASAGSVAGHRSGWLSTFDRLADHLAATGGIMEERE